MKRSLRHRDRCSGSASVEFAIVAPVLLMAALSTADIGLAIHEAFEIDQALRNGTQMALDDPGEALVDAVLAGTDSAGSGQRDTTWQVARYCACPESAAAPTACSTTCTADRPTAIFYDITGVRPYSGILLPARELSRSASVQVR